MAYDVIIIGAGPAGIFAAHRLSKENLNILVVDKGSNVEDRFCPRIGDGICRKCRPCNIMCGLGGSGVYSDGTLNLRYDIGGDLTDFVSEEKAQKLVDDIDKIFQDMGASSEIYGQDNDLAHELEVNAASHGVEFLRITQRHMGSENTPKIIKKFGDILMTSGVDFKFRAEVTDIIVEDGRCVGITLSDGEEIRGEKVLLTPGRIGAAWADKLCKKHDVKNQFGPIDVGVRVELPSLIMEKVVSVNHDPKFHIQTHTYDDFVRTFCTNHQGYVVEEKYDGYVGVNGHSMKKTLSGNSNFAFLVRISLTEPVEDSIGYGESIAKLATTIGGGKPVTQRLHDLRGGRRSHPQDIEKAGFKSTLKNSTAGDISMALPHRIVVDILEGLEKLNKVIPGVNDDQTLLHAPEIKYYATKVVVDKDMSTSLPGLYAAGDGTGLSRDIVNAAATGILAAEGMLR